MPNQNESNLSDEEAPLEGLIEKPMHLMDESEIRAFVVRMRELRESSQARQAFFRGGKVEKPTAFDEF